MTALLPAALALAAQAAGGGDEPFVPRVEPASGEAAAAIGRFEPEEGIVVELFAGEPMLANPVCLYVDHGGDVYVGETFRHHTGVTDMRDHMGWLDEDLANRTVADRLAMIRRHEGDERYDAGYGRAFERVRLIRDTDGDGVADEAIVFADDFSGHADGIGAGLLSYRGDVYYACIPDLWLLRDTDGDGRADEQRPLSSGYGVNIALLGHDLHGLRIGPDRRLYFSCGDRGFHVETPRGVLAHAHTGAVLRCELDGSNLEVWHTGLRNPQELVFDELGNLFTGDNNSDGGDRARWVNVVEGGESGWRYAYQWITEPVLRGPWNDEKLWHPPHAGQAAYVVPPIANLAHGPSGLTYYPGTGLPARYAGHFFLCDFRGDATYSGIHTYRTHPRGAFWELGEVRPFLWNTLVTDADFGPDGALWFSDWVHGWNKTGKGRVYRAFHPETIDSALVRETRALLASDLEALPSDELVELLGHPDQRVRQEAHFALAGRGAVDELADVARGGAELLPRVHAVQALGIAGRADPAALEPLQALTADADAEVRAQAVRVLGDERFAPAADAVLVRLADEAPRVRFFAALAAGRLRLAAAVEPLAALLRGTGTGDPNLRHAGVMGLLGCASPADLERLGRDPSPHVRMAVLLVLRRQQNPAVARFLRDADPLLVLEAARAVHDVPIPEAYEDLAALAARDVADLPEGSRAALVRRVLAAQLVLEEAGGVARLAAREDLDVALRVEALELLAAWTDPPDRDLVTGEWRPLGPRAAEDVLAQARALGAGPLVDGPPEVAAAFARLVATTGDAELAAPLGAWVEDPARPSGVRVAALEALARMEHAALPRAVRASLGDPAGEVRAAALEALEGLDPGDALASLPAILAGGEIAERRTAFRILARTPGAETEALLGEQLALRDAGLLPAELELDLVLAAESHGGEALAAALRRRQAARSRDPQLAPWLDTLFGGDAERGRKVFQRADLSCVRCHVPQEGTPPVGPDLAGVAARLTRLQLVESIAAPNRRTTPGYDATVLYLTDGDVVNGRVVEEAADAIRVLTSDGELVTVDPADVEERRPDLSAMPQDLAESLTRREMRDLLAYVASL